MPQNIEKLPSADLHEPVVPFPPNLFNKDYNNNHMEVFVMLQIDTEIAKVPKKDQWNYQKESMFFIWVAYFYSTQFLLARLQALFETS